MVVLVLIVVDIGENMKLWIVMSGLVGFCVNVVGGV